MKKILAVLLALICIAGLGTGFAGADALEPDVIEDETMLIMPILGTALPLPVELITVYHPLSMLITDTEADKLQALADMVWLPAGDEAPAGFYYPKVLSIPTVPDGCPRDSPGDFSPSPSGSPGASCSPRRCGRRI